MEIVDFIILLLIAVTFLTQRSCCLLDSQDCECSKKKPEDDPMVPSQGSLNNGGKIDQLQSVSLSEPDENYNTDCETLPCGLYPDFQNCSSYIVCAGGARSIKHCNDGQLFDQVTEECRNSEASKCSELETTVLERKNLEFNHCKFHNKLSTTRNGNILSSPVVTNWGKWGPWLNCSEGSYFSGIYAWKRVLRVNGLDRDHAGIVSLSIQCRAPNGIIMNTVESIAPGISGEIWPSYYTCKGGVAVGFRLNSQEDKGKTQDNLAADNIQLICGCGPPVYKPYEIIEGSQKGNRGVWTEPQICNKRQALCSLQSQMQNYREDSYRHASHDNTGLNNVRMECCDVPNPVSSCLIQEIHEEIGTCINDKPDSIHPLYCQFPVYIGISYDFEGEENKNSINFFESIDYNINNLKDSLKDRFTLELGNRSQSGMFDWSDAESYVFSPQFNATKKILVAPKTRIMLTQLSARCGHFLIKTNEYIKIEVHSEGIGNSRNMTNFRILL